MQDVTKLKENVLKIFILLLNSKRGQMGGPWGFVVMGMVGLLVSSLIGIYVVIPILQNVTTIGSNTENDLNTTLDAWYSLAEDDLRSLTAINATAGNTLVEDTDYHVDYSGGRINVTIDDDEHLINTTYGYYPTGYVTGAAGTIIGHVPTMVALGIFMLSVLLIGVGGFNIYQERKR